MWSEKTVVDQRREFTWFASQEGANMTELCRRYEVSRTTGYEWLARFVREGPPGLVDRSRRPHDSPRRTPEAMEGRVLALRDAHPHWGGRKLRRLLLNEGVDGVPAPSTITRVLERHGRLDGEAGGGRSPWQRFEHEAPNDLWQMDFKGPLRLLRGTAHILTVLDDHSRFVVVLEGCADQRGTTVQDALTRAFRQYGLPVRMLVDNGSPWGSDRDHPYTPLTVWLLRLGVGVSHGRPYHPQTQGKAERFHGTLEVELLRGREFDDLPGLRPPLQHWRGVYNWERPHLALELATPGSRYQPSPRSFPERLSPIEYGPDDEVRRVQQHGVIHFRGREYRVGKAFRGYPVALRPLLTDGHYAVYFCHHEIATINCAGDNERSSENNVLGLRPGGAGVNHVLEHL